MEPEDIMTLAISSMAFAFGIPLHIFIIGVSIRAWIKNRHSPVDLILFALGVSSMIIQSLELLGEIAYNFFHDFYYSVSVFYYYSFYNGTLLSNCCFASWLGTFYCIKIVSFQHRLIISLKMRFPKLLPRLLLGSIVLSFVLMTALIVIIVNIDIFIDVNNNTQHDSQDKLIIEKKIGLCAYAVDLGCSVPLIILVISLGLSISSLGSHIWTIQKRSSSLSIYQLKGHINAAKTMTLLLMLQIFFFSAQMYLDLYSSNHSIVFLLVSTLMYDLFCPLQALTLIFGNKRLCLACGVFSHPCRIKRLNIN